MDKSVIKRHNFEIEKKKIQTFSNNLPSNPSFSKYEVDGGLFNWGNHKITGEEMNGLVDKVQDRMISINGTFRSVISAFRDVYKALDYLDKEYINGILISVEGAEKASQQALSAHEENQKTIQALQKTVQKLKDFKDSVSEDLELLSDEMNNLNIEINKIKLSQQKIIESYDFILSVSNNLQQIEHIHEIDMIWNDVQRHQNNIESLRNKCIISFNKLEEETKQIGNCVNYLKDFYNELKSFDHLEDIDAMWSSLQTHSSNIDQLNNFISRLRSINHLFDIDIVWNNLQKQEKDMKELSSNFKSSFNSLNETTKNINKDLNILKEYQLQLQSYTHLNDIDDLWNKVESHCTELGKLQEQDKEISRTIELNEESIQNTINSMKEKYTLEKLESDKRIKIAYYIAGISIALSVIHYILQLTSLL